MDRGFVRIQDFGAASENEISSSNNSEGRSLRVLQQSIAAPPSFGVAADCAPPSSTVVKSKRSQCWSTGDSALDSDRLAAAYDVEDRASLEFLDRRNDVVSRREKKRCRTEQLLGRALSVVTNETLSDLKQEFPLIFATPNIRRNERITELEAFLRVFSPAVIERVELPTFNET